jgi:hypothetical protein
MSAYNDLTWNNERRCQMKLSEMGWDEWVFAAIITILMAFLLLVGWSPAQGQTVDEMQDTITYIASDECGGRKTASPGIYRAQQYIAEKLRDAGLDPRYQEFQMRGVKCRNIVASVQGYSNQYIVVGAHLDHIGTRGRSFVGGAELRRGRVMNGADDNASGSAMALAMAIALHKQQSTSLVPIRHSVVFVWFTGEEHGFWGSEYFVKNPIAPVHSELKTGAPMPIFMLNLDMVGRLRGGDYRDMEFLPADPLPVVEILERLYTRYDFGKKIVFLDEGANSDHYPFHQQGIPYVFLHTGLHADYHRSTDDADKINYEGMLKITHFAQDLIVAILNANEVEYDFINGVIYE